MAGGGEEVPRLPERLVECLPNFGVLVADFAGRDALERVDELGEVGRWLRREQDVNVVGTAVDVLDVHAEVLGDVAGNLTDAFGYLVGEDVRAVLCDGHKVVLERVDRVRPFFKVVLHLAVSISIHPILIKVRSHGVFGLQPTVERETVVGFTPAVNGGILALKKR